MKLQLCLPSLRETIIVLCATILFFLLTSVFIGVRTEHLLLFSVFLFLFFLTKETRKLAIGLLPFMIFGVSYDWMRVFPNYMVNPIDVEDLYNLEKSWFGIHTNGQYLIPCEYFAIHHWPVMDFFAGIFYLGWVPLPILFSLYLYFRKERGMFLRFSMVFLFVNLIGFAGYYIHPAAPPWYVMNYGFEAILNTPGNTAGLGRFDAIIGFPVFGSIYGRNSNVFAAIPSLHSAYLVIVFYYAIVRKSNFVIILISVIFMCGIWFTAVYSSHHYIIDVILGVICALIGILVFEFVLLKLRCFKNFFDRYQTYIA